MEVHVVNGDALAHKFPVPGTVIVCRECLMEGPVSATIDESFWMQRGAYLAKTFQGEPEFYFSAVKPQFDQLKHLPNGAPVNLWFEHDLFCQVNMWFVIAHLLKNNFESPLFRILPAAANENIWLGFGRAQKEDLEQCFRERIQFSRADMLLGKNLWHAYAQNDLQALMTLSKESSSCFPYLQEVCAAHIDRTKGRLQKRLNQIMEEGHRDFSAIFSEFARTEGIYGFGDLQVKNLLATLEKY